MESRGIMLEAKRIKSSSLSLSILAVTICISAIKIDALSLRTSPAISFVTRREILRSEDEILTSTRCSRGGAIDLDEESDVGEEYDIDEEYDVDEYDSDNDVEVDEDDALAASAVSAVEKVKKKKSEEAKRAMSEAILQSKVEAKKRKRKKSPSLLKKVPYILRAFMNPFTVLAMTKGYFASLMNIDYMQEQEDSSQNLRSALEEKARKSGPSKGKKPRKMRPGQAKTLSDLPQLSA